VTRVAINGFGRIGRNVFRASLERSAGFEIVAIDDLGEPETMAHLLAHDSLLGPLGERVQVDGTSLVVRDQELRALSSADPAVLPWAELGIDVVVESTGRFEKREQAQEHLKAGASKVVISAVANDAFTIERGFMTTVHRRGST
jgi:glyceraldehyde 3-phosphate dehydrogenase